MRLAVVAPHPIQYYTPVYRALAARCDLHVFYGQPINAGHHARSGFGFAFEWDVDLLSGYPSSFLANVSKDPDVSTFRGCDTPGIAEALERGRFDVVLISGWYQKTLLQALVAAKRLGIPAMVRGDSHLGTPRGPLKRLAQRIAYPTFLRRYDAALYVGARSKAFWDHHRYPAERQFFSPHCVDDGWFAARATRAAGEGLRRQAGIHPTAPVVLFAGKLIPLKRPLDAVKAVQRVRFAGVPAELLVAGSGELAGELEVEASALGVPLHALGFRNQTEMPTVYAAADVLTLLSDYETWGLVCNEALASGTPIVVSDAVGCAPDLAADGHIGRQFPVGDTDALARALLATFRSPPSRDAIAAVSTRYSLNRAVDGILAAAEATARRKPPGIHSAPVTNT